jgi:RimJ/RimL family protein N-acetyltransferase
MDETTEPMIDTPRLELHHLGVREMVTLFEDPEDTSIYAGRSYTNPYRVLMDDNKPLAWRVPQAKADPSANRWFVRLVVLRETGFVIGSTSFHAPPDARGMLEIGLGLHEDFRGQGFGTETVHGMWTWAVAQPEVRTLRYTVSKSNVASVRLVGRFNFNLVGSQIDDKDGPEDVYELSASEFRRLQSR